MADLLGTTFSVGNGLSSGGSSNSQLLVDAFRRTRQPEVDALTTKKQTLERSQVFYNRLRSGLQALTTQIDSFLSPSTNSDAVDRFRRKNSTSSDTATLTVATKPGAVVGATQVKVDRLAANDILVSNRVNREDTVGFAQGTYTFELASGSTSKEVTVEFDGTETNDKALAKIVSAINGTDDLGITASVVRDTGSTARLTLTAKTSGTENAVRVVNDGANILSQFGLTSSLSSDPAARTAFTTTAAGYSKANSSELDSQIQVNGITITRSTNKVEDAIEGLTFTLLKPQDATANPITVNTATDPQGVASSIRPLIDAYNSTIRLFNENQATTRGDFSVRLLQSDFRSISRNSFGTGDYKFLSDIGLKFSTDGTLAIDKIDVLQKAVEDNPEAVNEMMTNFARALQGRTSTLVGDKGLISSRTTSLGSQITAVNRQSKQLTERIDKQAESLRREYESIQRVFLQAQAQFSSFSAFTL